MKMEDKLIQEYRSRQVDFGLPLPENGWEKLDAALSATSRVHSFPYRWLAAAVSFLAILGSALYFMGIDKEIEPVLSDIVLPTERGAGTPAPVVTPVEVVKPLPVTNKRQTVALSKTEPELTDLSKVMSEVYVSISAYFHAEVEEDHAPENHSNTHSVVESRGRNDYLPEKNYRPLPEKQKTSSGKGWTLGLYAGNLFNRNSSSSGGLQMFNMSVDRTDVSVNNNPVSGTFEDYMRDVASNAPNFSNQADYKLFEQIAAGNYQKPTGTKIKHKFPVSAGLSVKKKINERLSLESGLIYTFLSSDLSAGEADGYQQEQRLHYLGIPLKASYKFWEKDRLSLYASAGVMAEMCVDGKLETDYFLNNASQRKSKTDLDIDQVQFSAMASLGVQYAVAKPVSIYAEPGIAYYFDDKSAVETIRKERPFNASVQFGVRLSF